MSVCVCLFPLMHAVFSVQWMSVHLQWCNVGLFQHIVTMLMWTQMSFVLK